jgi:hypothetical protein
MDTHRTIGGGQRPQGSATHRVVRELGNLALQRDPDLTRQAPKWWRIQNAIRRLQQGERVPPEVVQWLGKTLGFATLTSGLSVVHHRARPDLQPERVERLHRLIRAGVPVSELVGEFGGELIDYGLVSRRLITDVGVAYLVDAWQNSVELEDMKFHGVGTGTTGAAQGDTDVETELTTQYNPDNTRATGSLTEGGSANIFRTVGTNSFDASAAITEHGLLSNATVGSGVLWDRHVFAAINVVSGDSLQTTYDMTASAGG